MKGEASVEAGGNWEERGSGAARGLLKAGSGGTLGREVETEGELIVPGRGSEVDRPAVVGRLPTGPPTVRGGVGLAGGVVSIPLSSIIFSVVFILTSAQNSCNKML